MRPLTTIVSFLTVATSVIAATTETTVPACGLLCIEVSTLASTCSITNTTCICMNTALNAAITECVTANCTIKEQLETEKYSYESCGVQPEDRRSLVWIIGVTFGALGLLTFAIRCFARLHIGTQQWGLDDWAISLAVCFMIPLCAISVPLSQHGLGLDMWGVSFDDITDVLYFYYWDELLYITALALTKISILFFYLKVFPKRSFRICTYTLIGLNICYGLGYDLILIFQCHPIQGAWLRWDGEYEATCVSINTLGWSAAAINIFLDLATIILPLPELFRLSMSWKKKAQIILMFAVGLFVTLVSVIRLRSLIEFGTTTNLTQDYVETGYWSTIEVPVGVICACMPAVRSLFSQVFPNLFGTTKHNTSEFGYSGRNAYASKPKTGGTISNSAIHIKKEWTMLSSEVDNHKDLELMQFEKIDAHSSHPYVER
ncbi:cfem domain-containing protein [Xylariales sp. PMI_506]|nr:cfem domain-containing protein [Xylariales sp. PMI_506]